MFRFTQEPSSGSQRQCLAKLQVWFHCACWYECCQCYGGICRLREPKHVGADFTFL